MRVMKKSNFRSVDIDRDGKFDLDKFPIFVQYLTNLDTDVSRLFSALQSGLRIVSGTNSQGENLLCQEITVADTGLANTEFSVSHSLNVDSVGIVPTRYFVSTINKGGVIYTSGTTWTTTSAYFKCTVANATVKIILLP